MNKQINCDYTKYNIKEALEELQKLYLKIENFTEFDEIDLQISLEQIYHHLNTSWNARYSSKKEAEECSEKNFEHWRKFPVELNL